MRKTLPCLLAVTLLLTGCGDDDGIETGAGSTTSTTGADADASSSTTSRGPTGSPTAGSDELPGERIDIFPYEGALLAVVGVPAGDVLNVRAAPGPENEVVAELDSLADGISPTGHNRQLAADSIWAEVDVDGERGWVNIVFVAHLGATEDATARLYPTPADRPSTQTLALLAERVGADVATVDGPGPRVMVVDGPTVGDVGEVTIDVLGFPDDAQIGERVRIFAEPGAGGESFTVRSVESTLLCRRGVTDGRCA